MTYLEIHEFKFLLITKQDLHKANPVILKTLRDFEAILAV
jgi:hypothetical protein